MDKWEVEDGVHDLWRRTIFKFYSRVIGDRDYSLFECMHFALQLPGVLSNFGQVHSASLANWAPLKRSADVRMASEGERVTHLSKLELFNRRALLLLPKHFPAAHLSGLSFFAFWRLFDVRSGRLVVRQWEAVVALTGTGWPSHAHRLHPRHQFYAQRVLYAYMPCEGFRGTDYIDAAVERHYQNDWGAALQHFVRDENNLWCPKWIRRNYETHNKEKCPVQPQEPVATSQPANSGDDAVTESDSCESETQCKRARLDTDTLREPWQAHSALGPNTHAESALAPEEPFPATVNSPAHPWSQHACFLQPDSLPPKWHALRQTVPDLTLPASAPAALRDASQRLFLQIVMNHMHSVFEAAAPAPLRLLLLGTAGTGKTFAVQTLLHHLHVVLRERHLPSSTVRVAAPTGSAAFNMRWGATTVHRLIHWFRPPHFSDLPAGSEALLRFQEAWKNTALLVLDEISMIGRQMMGRIECRLRQSGQGRDTTPDVLGGLSCVCVGDPAQCEAIFDQQIYDVNPRVPRADASHVDGTARLSNLGLEVFSSFTAVIVLRTPQRVNLLSPVGRDLTPPEQDYNSRAERFLDVLHRLRDLTWTPEDYYWLCKRKKSAVPLGERLRFKDAPVLMEFRRTTEGNPEHNCDFFNRMKLRRLAQETNTSVARFVAVHEGIPHSDGLRLDAAVFSGLPADLELAEGALVIIILNLAVEHGLMNGTHGIVTKIVYTGRKNPLCQDPRDALPDCVVVDCPQYVGPPFFAEPAFRTWIPLLPRTISADYDSSVTRTQFPLTLAWALTPWKAQGMTLQKVVVNLGAKASSPGVAFVALTRVRHPDDLLLEDAFPAMATIMRQRDHASFAARVKWEQRQTVLFARTLRMHMTDAKEFPECRVWTENQGRIADRILTLLRDQSLSDEQVLQQVAQCDDCAEEDIKTVWDRLHVWPHSAEIEHAKTLHSDSRSPPAAPLRAGAARDVASITDGRWRIARSDLKMWLSDGTLTFGSWEFFARLLRDKLPEHVVLYQPEALAAQSPHMLTKRLLRLPSAAPRLPCWRIYPWRPPKDSANWTIFFYLHRDRELTILTPNANEAGALSRLRDILLRAFATDASTTLLLDTPPNNDFEFFAHIHSYVASSSLASTDFQRLVVTHAKQFATVLLSVTEENTTANLRHLFVANAALRDARDSLLHIFKPPQLPSKTHAPPDVARACRLHQAPSQRSWSSSPPAPQASTLAEQSVATWRCPPNNLGFSGCGRTVLAKPNWYNDPTSGLVNAFGCQIGASCGLLALNHILRGLGVMDTPLTLHQYQAATDDAAHENFDLLPLLSCAGSLGVKTEPLPAARPEAAYLLHFPGHFVALVPTRLGCLLCDSLWPLPFILTVNEADALLRTCSAMQTATAHADFLNPDRAGGWMGVCFWTDRGVPLPKASARLLLKKPDMTS